MLFSLNSRLDPGILILSDWRFLSQLKKKRQNRVNSTAMDNEDPKWVGLISLDLTGRNFSNIGYSGLNSNAKTTDKMMLAPSEIDFDNIQLSLSVTMKNRT